MAKSILETKGSRECYECGSTQMIEEHHIFHGTANQKKSEKYGLKVHLCYMHHRDSTHGVHGGNYELDGQLKRVGQQEFEKKYSHEKFMQEFGRNYL